MREDFLWVEKHRPKRVADTVLPEHLKDTFQQFVKQGNIPNITLAGPPGGGKTTVAKAMCDELDADYIVINGSLNAGIDTLRNEIQQFASSVSFSGGRKYVILDEADYLSTAVQAALRNFMEEYSSNCGFILTCNLKNRISDAVLSRAPVIDLKVPAADKAKIAVQFMKRVQEILDSEGVSYQKEALAAVIQRHFPDFRKTLNTLQRYAAATGTIDSGALVDLQDASLSTLKDFIRTKNFSSMRKWVGENSDIEPSVFYRALYEKLAPDLEPNSAPQLVLILADYQFKSAFVADQEINTTACLTEIMASVVFK